MLAPNNRPDPSSPQAIIAEIVSVAAEGRLHDNAISNAKAFASATLYLRPGGALTIHNVTVFHEEGRPPAVLFPSRKGDKRSFPIVEASGEIRRAIEQAVLREYERLRGATE